MGWLWDSKNHVTKETRDIYHPFIQQKYTEDLYLPDITLSIDDIDG